MSLIDIINKNTSGSIISNMPEPKLSLNAIIEKNKLNAEAAKVEGTGGSPIFNLPSKKDIPGEDFGTGLELTEKQIKNFEAVKNENSKREEKLRAMDTIYPGIWAEYQEYQANEGGVGFFAKANRRMENLVTPVFNVLQMPSWVIGATIDEAVKTGNVWDSYKAFMGGVYANLPFSGGLLNRAGYKPDNVDILGLATRYGFLDPKARPITKERIKKASKIGLTTEDLEDWEAEAVTSSEMQAWMAGLLGTIFLDPLNKTPANIAKIPGRAYNLVKETSAGKPVTDVLETMFKIEPKLPEKHREELLSIKRRFGAEAENEIVKMADEVESMVAWMTPVERRVLGTLMDQPKFMEKQIDALVKADVILAENAPKLKESAKIIQSFTKRLFDAEVNTPLNSLIDPTMFRDFYLYGTGPKDPRLVEAYKNVANTRRPDPNYVKNSDLPGIDAVFGPGQPKTYKSQLDRVMASISGDLEKGTELDIGNILLSRGVKSVRHVVSQRFGEAVLTNPEIATKLNFDPMFFKGGKREQGYTWDDIKKTIETPIGETGPTGDPGQGMSVYEVKRKVKVSDDLDVGPKYKTEIIGAYRLPTEVYNFLTRSEELFSSPEKADMIAQAFTDITNIWKGWATFGTGYHARNTISILNSNWMAGMGRDEKGRFSMGAYMLRNLQALKLMSVANGAGRLPKKTKRIADRLAKKFGWNSLNDIPDVDIKDIDGNPLSYAQIAELGEKNGVPQVASSLYNTEGGASELLWNTNIVDDLVAWDFKNAQAAQIPGLDPSVAQALEFGKGQGTSFKDKLKYLAGGGKNPIIGINRAASQIIENQGRWALFIDQLAQGKTVEAAAEMPRMWHFDYRMLTDLEKKYARNILPFYAWQRFAAPRVAMALLETPGRMSQIPKVKDAVEGLYPDFQNEDVPDYWDEVVAWQLPYMNKDQDQPIAAQIDIPIVELNRLNIKDMLSSANPLIAAPMQIYGNIDIFKGGAISRFGGEVSTAYQGSESGGDASVSQGGIFPFLGLSPTKDEEWAYEKIWPPIGKWNRYVKSKQTKGNEIPIPGLGVEVNSQLLSELSGFKFRLLDKRRLFRGKTYKESKYGREFELLLRQRAQLDKEFGRLFPELGYVEPKYQVPRELFSPVNRER